MEAEHILGIIDALGGVIMLWAMQKITTRAGFKGSQARWALLRRTIYAVMAFAMFGLGIDRLANDYPVETIAQCCYQGALLFGVMFFPLLRALGFTTQDLFLGLPPERNDGWPPLRQ